MFRIVRTLAANGYLDEQGKSYRLSPKILSLGYAAVQSTHLISACLDEMRSLRDEINETIFVGALSEGRVVILEELPSFQLVKFTIEIGHKVPIHASAPGKAILSFLPSAEQKDLLAHIAFTRFNDRTIPSMKAMMQEIEKVQGTGYALDLGEEVSEIWCAASPVFDYREYPIASIWLSGPEFRLSHMDLEKVGSVVREHALRVSKHFGYDASVEPVSGAEVRRGRERALFLTAGRPWRSFSLRRGRGGDTLRRRKEGRSRAPMNLVHCQSQCGESPIWEPVARRLCWIDTENPVFTGFDPATGRAETTKTQWQVQAIGRRRSGGWIAVVRDGFAFLDADPARGRFLGNPVEGVAHMTMNDGAVGPDGRFYAGSFNFDVLDAPDGCLYRVDTDAAVATIETGIVLPNGIAFSPDGRDNVRGGDVCAQNSCLRFRRAQGHCFAAPSARHGARRGGFPGRAHRRRGGFPLERALAGLSGDALRSRRQEGGPRRRSGADGDMHGVRRARSRHSLYHHRKERAYAGAAREVPGGRRPVCRGDRPPRKDRAGVRGLKRALTPVGRNRPRTFTNPALKTVALDGRSLGATEVVQQNRPPRKRTRVRPRIRVSTTEFSDIISCILRTLGRALNYAHPSARGGIEPLTNYLNSIVNDSFSHASWVFWRRKATESVAKICRVVP